MLIFPDVGPVDVALQRAVLSPITLSPVVPVSHLAELVLGRYREPKLPRLTPLVIPRYLHCRLVSRLSSSLSNIGPDINSHSTG